MGERVFISFDSLSELHVSIYKGIRLLNSVVFGKVDEAYCADKGGSSSESAFAKNSESLVRLYIIGRLVYMWPLVAGSIHLFWFLLDTCQLPIVLVILKSTL